MRLNLNINVYYEGLYMDQINKIWSEMLDMKPTIDDLEYIYYKLDREFTEKELFVTKIRKLDLAYKIEKLDNYIIGLGKTPIFGTEYKENELYSDDQAKMIIEKYRFLMSKPE